MAESDTNVVTLIHMLNTNVNELRVELLKALEDHETKEMDEIQGIKNELKELQTWKWRMFAMLVAAISFGVIHLDTTSLTF